VAPEANGVIVSASSSLYDSDIAAAIVWAVDHGAKVISVSLGSTSPNQAVLDACAYAVTNGAVTVWAAGNVAGLVNYPQTTSPDIFVAGGVYPTGEMAGLGWWDDWTKDMSSTYGSQVDFVSAFDAVTNEPDGKFTKGAVKGTSFSAPVIAGVIQLVLAANPALTGWEAAQIVKSTAIRPKPLEPWMFDAYFPADCGIPDAEAAVLKAKALANPGVVYPYLRLHRPTGVYPVTSSHLSTSYPGVGAWDDFSDGITSRVGGGVIGFQIEGFCSTGPVTEVELWINGVREYIGPPRNTWAGLYEREEWRDRLWDLRVVARTA
jgi:subtilisin family serine protease